MNTINVSRFVDQLWNDSILPQLVEYIRIPNKSPHFDPQWREHGYMDAAVALIERWCREQPLRGMQLEGANLVGALLAGAVAYAREMGAPAIEAYPIDPKGRRIDVAFGFVGFTSMFEAAGFRRVVLTSAHSAGRPRWLMRLELDRV